MTDRDDYLFDPAAPRDPDVEALERALAPLRFEPRPLRELPPGPAPALERRWLVPVAAVAAVLLVLLIAFAVLAALATGKPAGDELRPGAEKREFVATHEPVAVALGELATITLRPHSELAFVHWRADQALFALRRGALLAEVAPPPAVAPDFFVVDTPHGRVVDKGCRYELEVREHGSSSVRVIEGRVMFTGRGGRVLFVPAGAAAEIGPNGPSTPLFAGASPQLVGVTRKYDQALAGGEPLDVRAKLLETLVQIASTPRDTLPLWHLLRDPDEGLRTIAEQRLLELVGPPEPSKERTFDPEVWLPFLRQVAWQ